MAIEPLEDNGIIKNQQNNFFRKKKRNRFVIDDKILVQTEGNRQTKQIKTIFA